MKTFNIVIQDIYEHEKQKYISVNAINSYEAHKEGLKYTNALREEIILVKDANNKIAFTLRDGFNLLNE